MITDRGERMFSPSLFFGGVIDIFKKYGIL